MNKKIMILGASILQVPGIRKALEMGLDVVVVDMDPNAIGFEIKGVIKEVISTIDTPLVLEAAKRHKIDGIMTLASDMPIRTIAKVCKEMDLIGIDEETALKATDKGAMREALKVNNVPIPEYYRVYDKNEFVRAVSGIISKGYKCIIKPSDNSGSRGIDLLTDYSDEALIEAYKYAKQYSRSGHIMVEEYMEGPEVSVEILTKNGIYNVIQITDKLTTGAPYFVEMGHSQPSMLDDSVANNIASVAIQANKAIGIVNGPSHVEIKVTESGPKIVEIGARLGGDCISTHLVPLSTGVDMVECCINILLNNRIDCNPKFNKSSAIRYIPSKNGIISKITGTDDVLKDKNIVQLSFVCNVGDQLIDIKSSTDRLGFVISKGNDALEAIEACEIAISKIKVEVENGE